MITNGLTIALAARAGDPALPGGRDGRHAAAAAALAGGAARSTRCSAELHADLALHRLQRRDAEAGVTNINLPEAEVKARCSPPPPGPSSSPTARRSAASTSGDVADAAAVNVLITDPTAPAAALAELRALDGPRIVLA